MIQLESGMWKTTVCNRDVYIDNRLPVVRITAYLRNFIYDHADDRGYMTGSRAHLEGEIEAFFSHRGMPEVKCVLENNSLTGVHLWAIEIYFNDMDFPLNVTHKVHEVLRGA